MDPNPSHDKQIEKEEIEKPDIDEALEETFPASDPPCWTCGREADEE